MVLTPTLGQVGLAPSCRVPVEALQAQPAGGSDSCPLPPVPRKKHALCDVGPQRQAHGRKSPSQSQGRGFHSSFTFPVLWETPTAARKRCAVPSNGENSFGAAASVLTFSAVAVSSKCQGLLLWGDTGTPVALAHVGH